METLHMSIGKNIGTILLEIAQEHIAKGDIQKGIDTYIKSLHGFTEDLAILVLKNEYVIVSDNDTVALSDDKKLLDKNAHNIYDWNTIINKKLQDIEELYKSLNNTSEQFNVYYTGDICDYNIHEMMQRYFKNDELKNIGLHTIAARIIGSENCKLLNNQLSNPQDIWDRFEDSMDLEDSKHSKWEKILFLTVQYNKLIRRMHKEYIAFEKLYLFLRKYDFIAHISMIEHTCEKFLDVLCDFANTHKGYYNPLCNTDLYKYKITLQNDLKNTVYGNEYLCNGIIKKDIMDGYDGGWLSPTGEFYADNGPVSSFIHMNIANKIFLAKENPYSIEMVNDGVNEYGATDSPDYWLECHGWVKIHNNDCYGYFMDHRNPTEDTPYAYRPTDIQIKMICDYADKFYNGKFYTEANALGRFKHTEPYSTYKVRQMDDIKLHEIFSL